MILILIVDKAAGTSLDIALAFARYAGKEVMPGVNKPLDDIVDALRLSPLVLAMANQFAASISRSLTKMAFNLVIFGYLIPSMVIVTVTFLTCWYIREEIRNLYPMLVPFPVCKKACDEFLQKMDKKLIEELKKKEEKMAVVTVTVNETTTQ